jgi:hypothetical protein
MGKYCRILESLIGGRDPAPLNPAPPLFAQEILSGVSRIKCSARGVSVTGGKADWGPRGIFLIGRLFAVHVRARGAEEGVGRPENAGLDCAI